jgi:hypothetical protein
LREKEQVNTNRIRKKSLYCYLLLFIEIEIIEQTKTKKGNIERDSSIAKRSEKTTTIEYLFYELQFDLSIFLCKLNSYFYN